MGPERTLKLRYTRQASEELAAILDYIESQSPMGAINVAARLRRLIDLLPDFPHAGRTTQVPTLRVLSASPYPYLVYYELVEDDVIIVGFRHARRRPDQARDL